MSLLLQGQPSASTGNELKEATRQLESLLVKQMLASSNAFKASNVPGASIHADLFIEALADAVVQSGGLGLADKMESTLGPSVSPSSPEPLPIPALSSPSHALQTGAHITSGYGLRVDPFTHDVKRHLGVDIAGNTGDAIVAAAPGVVVFSGEKSGYGKVVEIEHAQGVRSIYAHASRLHVQEGDTVTQGQEIAEVGQSGRATGPHLHFEMKVQGKAVDPIRALKAYGVRVEELSRESPDS